MRILQLSTGYSNQSLKLQPASSRVTSIIFGLFFLSINLMAQISNSALQLYKVQPLDTLLAWMEVNYEESAETFIPISEIALDKAYETKDPYQIATTHDKIANWHGYNGFFPMDSLLFHSKKVVENFALTDDTLKLAQALKTIAIDYLNNQEYAKSLESNLKALETFEMLNHTDGIAGTYKNLASLHDRTGEYEKAIDYSRQAIEMFTQTNNQTQIAIVYMGLINTFNELQDYESAIQSANKCLEILDDNDLDEIYIKTRVYSFRGDSYLGLKQYDKAFADAEKSYSVAKEAAGEDRARSYQLEMGNVLKAQGKYAEALPYLETALAWYKDREEYSVSEPFKDMAECYVGLGQFESAYDYQKIASEIDIRTLEEKVENLENEGIIKYETGKKDQEIALQEVQLKQKSIVQLLTFVALGLFAVLLFGLLYNFRKNKKITTELENKNTENELLLKEIHHRVKNNLQTISSLLNLQSESINDETAFDAVQESKNRVASMALIHQKLYQGENLAAIEMKDYFKTIGKSIIDSFGSKSTDISFKVDMDPIELDVDTAVPIGLITNELITNSLKYAFLDSSKGQIKVKLIRDDNDLLRLEISDNGVFKQSEEKLESEAGFGTLLVNLLSMQLGGNIHRETENGTTIILKFKEQDKSAA